MIWLCALWLGACSPDQAAVQSTAGADITIYPAQTILTMDESAPIVGAVAVADGQIADRGALDTLTARYRTAQIDYIFADKTLIPGLIDPHIHMSLSSLQYATKLSPPWQMATPDGVVEGLTTRDAFLSRLSVYIAEAPQSEPLVIYGYHNLVHGDLDRADLDALTSDLPLIIWHYSSHDFYLNSAALDWAGITSDLHTEYEGIALDEAGQLTGRIFEDAIPVLLTKLGPILFTPDRLAQGLEGFSSMLRRGGVTSVADLGYGVTGRALEDANITANWRAPGHAGYRLFLVPEHRAFNAEFGDTAPAAIKQMIAGDIAVPAPVLPQVKFFADGAFYSQTMRVSEPGYLAGQSQGSEGLWVLEPDKIASTIAPYWRAGFDVRIHSNGDAAQTASLAALDILRVEDDERRFVFEHAGLFSPDHIRRAAALGASVSAASHYVYFLGQAYQAPLGPERGAWISPLGSLTEAGISVTLHSDAPLAPPLPLRAASVHMTRATREGDPLTPSEALTPQQALEAITIDAARSMRMEDQLGSIRTGLLADFTVLDANPLETPAEDWGGIGIWGTVLGGKLQPLSQ
jgi:predicted amidohydrolase YtcJ